MCTFFIYVLFIIISPSSALKKFNWPHVFCLAVWEWPVCLRSWIIAQTLRVSCLQEVMSSPHLWPYIVFTPSSEVTCGGLERDKMLTAFSAPLRCVILQTGTQWDFQEFIPAAQLALMVPQGKCQGPWAPMDHNNPGQPHLGPSPRHAAQLWAGPGANTLKKIKHENWGGQRYSQAVGLPCQTFFG